MKKTLLRSLVLAVVGTVFAVGSALALPVGANNAPLQGVFDGITTGPVVGDSSVNVATDYLSDTTDSYWSLTGSGASVNTLIVELAAFANSNTFGVYSGTDYVQIFDGVDGAGAQAFLSITADGSVLVNGTDSGVDFAGNLFGYYLDSSASVNGGLFHSDTSLNVDQMDHLAAFQGTDTDTVQLPGYLPGLWTANEYILAFEDLNGNVSDWDYTDFVVMVESVNPVPEPATMLLFGTGLVGLAGAARRRKK